MGTARLILAAALAIGGTVTARAADQPTASTPSQGNAFASNQFVGRIKSLGAQQRSVTVELNGQNESFALGNATTVFVEGRLGTVQDLKEGQEVRAAFENRGGEKSVRWIEVTPAAPSPAPPTNPGGH